MVWPQSQRATTEPSSASGMLSTTTITERQSRKNSSTMRPVNSAPMAPSVPTPHIAPVTIGDWSNANWMSTSGDASRIFGNAF